VYLQRVLVSEIQGDTLTLQSTELILGILGTRVRPRSQLGFGGFQLKRQDAAALGTRPQVAHLLKNSLVPLEPEIVVHISEPEAHATARRSDRQPGKECNLD
jgi:hypothetical protein